MPFSKVNYRVYWFQVAWVMEIDYGDGESVVLNEESVVAAIEAVRKQRRKYRSEAEFKNALKVYEDALNYLRKESNRLMMADVATRG